jgi:hypothetical protein
MNPSLVSRIEEEAKIKTIITHLQNHVRENYEDATELNMLGL